MSSWSSSPLSSRDLRFSSVRSSWKFDIKESNDRTGSLPYAHLRDTESFSNTSTQISSVAEEEDEEEEEEEVESNGSVSLSPPLPCTAPSNGKDTASYAATKKKSSLHRPEPSAHYRASCFCKDVEEEQQYFQQILGSSSAGWTDEKHSSYLDSMEADFLRNVMFEGNMMTQPSPVDVAHPASNASESSDLEDCATSQHVRPPEQFKIWRCGRWTPVSVQAPSYFHGGPFKQLVVTVKNPWIKRLRRPRPKCVPFLIMKGSLIDGKLY